MADGDVLSDSTATWTAYDQLAQTFTNAVTRSKTDAGTYAIAQWADEITNALADINSAANGEHVWTDAGITARFGGAPATGWNTSYDEAVFGDGSGNAGISCYIATSSNGGFAVRNGSSSVAGFMFWNDNLKRWRFGGNGSDSLQITASAYFPASDGSMTSATDAARWSAVYSAGTVYVADAPTTGFNAGADDLVIGDGSGSVGLSGYSSATGAFNIAARDSGSSIAGLLQYNHNSNAWIIFCDGSSRVQITTAAAAPTSAGGLTLGTSSLPWGNLLVFTSLKTANYTVTAGQRVPYDASGGTFTLTAPASPSQGERWAVKETADDATAITIAGNGSNIEDPVGGTVGASFSLGLAYVSVEWEYDGTAWRVI